MVRATAIGVVLCLWTLHAGVFGHVAAHSLAHARHKAATHSSVLCTWLCTAGEVSEVAAVTPGDGGSVTGSAEAWVPSPHDAAEPLESSSRAPPSLPR